MARRGARIGGVADLNEGFRRYAPAVAWMDVDATLGTRHVGLPSDLYLLTVYCTEGLICGELDESCDLEVMVSTLRSRPARFASLGRGQLAVAMLTPEGLMHVLRAPLQGIADQRVPLESLCGRDEQQRLRGRLMVAGDADARMDAFGRWIEARVLERRSLSPAESRVAQATAAMQQDASWTDGGMVELAAALGVTRRQMERDFNKWLGVSPASYARLVRFQRAAGAIADGMPILDAAFEGGYADQAHLTRTVRALASVTPRELGIDAARPGRAEARSLLAGRVLMVDPEAGAARDGIAASSDDQVADVLSYA
jgi:AraC-like DNA-binding protein